MAKRKLPPVTIINNFYSISKDKIFAQPQLTAEELAEGEAYILTTCLEKFGYKRVAKNAALYEEDIVK